MLSTRCALQKSCMSLYPRYEQLSLKESGAWFAARTDHGAFVGLSTARLGPSGGCRVDAFVHERSLDAWAPLMRRTIDWARARGAHTCQACVSVQDADKISLFASLEFQESRAGDPFDLDAGRVESIVLERKL